MYCLIRISLGSVETAGFMGSEPGSVCPVTAASPATRTKPLEINLVNRKAPMLILKFVLLVCRLYLVSPDDGVSGSSESRPCGAVTAPQARVSGRGGGRMAPVGPYAFFNHTINAANCTHQKSLEINVLQPLHSGPFHDWTVSSAAWRPAHRLWGLERGSTLRFVIP